MRSFQENGKFLNLREGAVFADYFKCGDPACGCKITYHQKKKPSGRIYHFYTCANGRKVHPSLKGRYLTEAEIFEGLEPALDAISITDDMALDVAGALNANHRALQQRLACEVNAYKSSLKAGEGREDELYGDLKRGILTEEMYQRQISAVRSERARLTDLIITLQSSVTDTYLHTAQEILELARDAKTLWKSRPREERAEFLKKILWNPRITGRTIEYELKKPFNVIAKMAGNDKWGG